MSESIVKLILKIPSLTAIITMLTTIVSAIETIIGAHTALEKLQIRYTVEPYHAPII